MYGNNKFSGTKMLGIAFKHKQLLGFAATFATNCSGKVPADDIIIDTGYNQQANFLGLR